MGEGTTELLWIDDLIRLYQSIIVELGRRGYRVTQADSAETGLEKIKNATFDIVVVDANLPGPGMDGERFLEKVVGSHPNTRFAVMSSYLNEAAVRKRLSALGAEVAVLEKHLGEPGSEVFEEKFFKALEKLRTQPNLISPKKYFNTMERNYKNKNPFRLTYSEFETLSVHVQRMLARKAVEQARPLLDRCFRQGAVWVLLCGSSTRAEMTAADDEHIPSSDQIRERARRCNRAYFAVRGPINLDDIACNEQRLPAYPTVTLSLGQRLGEEAREPSRFHFDTGSPSTFFDFELIERRGLIPGGAIWTTVMRDHGSRGKEPWEVCAFGDKEALLHDQLTDATIRVSLHGLAVSDWKRSTLARLCPATCGRYKKGRNVACVYRDGLVGRDLLHVNRERKLGIIIHDECNRTSFCESWPDLVQKIKEIKD